MSPVAAPAPLDLTRVGFQSRNIVTPAGQVRVFECGDGPPILLLHGIGGGASSYYWARLAPLLSQRYKVCAVDFVGWGDSDHPARFLLFDDYVSQIGALLDGSMPPLAVLAQGLAAGFAIAALKSRLDCAQTRLVLLSPTGGRDFGKDAFDPLFAWTLSVLARWPRVNMALYRRYFHRRSAYTFWFERRGFLHPERVPKDLVDAGLRSGSRPNAAYAALPFVGGALRYDIAPLLKAVDRPALMLWGAQEAQIPAAVRIRLGSLNPLIESAIVVDARTNFESECPVETADLVVSFLKKAAS